MRRELFVDLLRDGSLEDDFMTVRLGGMLCLMTAYHVGPSVLNNCCTVLRFVVIMVCCNCITIGCMCYVPAGIYFMLHGCICMY